MASESRWLGSDPAEAERFLACLYEDKPDPSSRILIWTNPGRTSHWYQKYADIVQDVPQWYTLDVYIGTCLAPRTYFRKNQRCKAEDVAAMPGVWADIDIAGTGHKKPKLPTDRAQALEWLHSVAPKPTITVWSGHGLQVWWLFDQWATFQAGNDPQRAWCSELSADWSRWLRAKAAERDWDIDATGDLARVLRLPGTVNHKGLAVPASVIELDSEVRYPRGELERWIKGHTAMPASQRVSLVRVLGPDALENVQVTVNPHATPPFGKWTALQDIDHRARQLLDRKARDVADQSPSGYDWHLAFLAVQAGWSDQEICDLLVYGRVKHNDDLKREDYYARTIARARDPATSANPTNVAAEAVHDFAENKADDVITDTQRVELLEHLSQLFGGDLQITNILRYPSDPPEYRMETNLGSVLIGTTKKLFSQSTMRYLVGSATNRAYIPIFKSQPWGEICRLMMRLSEDAPTDEDATEQGRVRSYLRRYFRDKPPQERDDMGICDITDPYVKDSIYYIFGEHFRSWVNLCSGDKITAKEMGASLSILGCKREQVAFKEVGRRTTRSVWRVSPEIIWEGSSKIEESDNWAE